METGTLCIYKVKYELRPKVRPLTQLDKSEWEFEGGICDKYQNLLTGSYVPAHWIFKHA